MRILFSTGLASLAFSFVQCTPREFNDSEVKTFEDVQKVERDQWGTYTVTCRNGNTESKISKEQIQSDQVCKTASSATFIGKTFCKTMVSMAGENCFTFLENGSGKEKVYGSYPTFYTFRWHLKPGSTEATPIIALECPRGQGAYEVYREAILQNGGTKLRVNNFNNGKPVDAFGVYEFTSPITTRENPQIFDCFAK
jgi:hypothetical protein